MARKIMKEIIEIISGIFIEKGENTKSEQIIENLFEFSEEHSVSEFINYGEMAIKLFVKNSGLRKKIFYHEVESEGIFGKCVTSISIFEEGIYFNRPKKPTQPKDGYVYTVIILSLEENQNEREGLTILTFNSKEELKSFLLTDNDVQFEEVTKFIESLKS